MYHRLSEQYQVRIDDQRYGSQEGMDYAGVMCQPSQVGSEEEPIPQKPAVIIIHGLFGLQEMDVRFAARLASKGYVSMVHGWQTHEQDPSDREIVDGIRDAVNFLENQPQVDSEKMALVGICRGGSIAMVAGAHISEFKALVSFYGQAHYPVLNEKKPVSPIDLTNHVSVPMLIIHGEEDSIFSFRESVEYEQRMKEWNKDIESHFYKGAEHGFFLEGHRNYHPEASEDAWGHLSAFFERRLHP